MLNRSTKYLMLGIFTFSLAGSAFYSPLPAYFLQYFSSSLVMVVFFGGSLAGAVAYLAVGRMGQGVGKGLVVSAVVRMLMIPALALAALGASPVLPTTM